MQAPGGMSERDERPGPPQRKKRKDEGRVVGYEAHRYNEDEAVMPLLVLLLLLLLLSPVVGDGKAVVKYGEVDKESVADGSDDEDMVVWVRPLKRRGRVDVWKPVKVQDQQGMRTVI